MALCTLLSVLFLFLWDFAFCCPDCKEVSGESGDPLVGFYELASNADGRCPDSCLYVRNKDPYCFAKGTYSVITCDSEYYDVGDNEFNSTDNHTDKVIVPLPPTLHPEYLETKQPSSGYSEPLVDIGRQRGKRSFFSTARFPFPTTDSEDTPFHFSFSKSPPPTTTTTTTTATTSTLTTSTTSRKTKTTTTTTTTANTTPAITTTKPNFADHVHLTFAAFLPLRFGSPWTYGIKPPAIALHNWNWLEGPPDWTTGDQRFNTDNRNWAAQQGSYKLRTDFTIFFKDLGQLNWGSFFRKTSVGTTHSIHTNGNPPAYIGGTHASNTAKASKLYSFENFYCSVKVCVKAAASNAFITSPSINYKVCFHIKNLQKNCDYEIYAEGSHNEFPSYEAEVNYGDIYIDHPTANGPGLFNLGVFYDNFETNKVIIKGPDIKCN